MIELSSFQLMGTIDIRPKIAVLQIYMKPILTIMVLVKNMLTLRIIL